MDADVDLYEGRSAYTGARCRRHPTVAIKDNKDAGLRFGPGFAQFRCPPMARYDVEQGTSSGPGQPKIRFDHTVRLVSSGLAQSSAFLLDARYHQVALAATVSGITDENLAAVRSLQRLARTRLPGQQIEASYEPARRPDQYAPVRPLFVDRYRAEEAVYVLKTHAKKMSKSTGHPTILKLPPASLPVTFWLRRLTDLTFGTSHLRMVRDPRALQAKFYQKRIPSIRKSFRFRIYCLFLTRRRTSKRTIPHPKTELIYRLNGISILSVFYEFKS